MPQWVQYPVVRPGCRHRRARRVFRSRSCRRTGALSGTCGSVRMAAAGSPLGYPGDVDDPGTEAATRADRGGRRGAPRAGRARGRTPWPRSRRDAGRRLHLRGGRRAAHVAVAVDNRSAATGFGAPHLVLPRFVGDRLLVIGDGAGHRAQIAWAAGQQAGRDPHRRHQVGVLGQTEPCGLRLVPPQSSGQFVAAVEQTLCESPRLRASAAASRRFVAGAIAGPRDPARGATGVPPQIGFGIRGAPAAAR